MVKRRYGRTNKNNATSQISIQEQRERRLKLISERVEAQRIQVRPEESERRAGTLVTATPSQNASDLPVEVTGLNVAAPAGLQAEPEITFCNPEDQYHMSKKKRKYIDLFKWTRDNPDDPAIKVFSPLF